MPNLLKVFVKMFLIITVIFTVFLYIFAIILGPLLFFLTPEGLQTSILHLEGLPIWILNVRTYIPIGIEFGIIFLFLWGIFTLSFIVAWKVRQNFLKTIKEGIFNPIKKLFKSSLFTLPILNSMTLIGVLAIQNIQEAGGIPTGTSPIDSNPFLDLVDLSYAAVSEEIGFRIVPIGVLIILFLLITTRKTKVFTFKQKIKLFALSFILPDKAKEMSGKKTVNKYGIIQGISLGEWVIVIFTSVLFGLAHFDPGVSWEIGKTTSAGFAGLALSLTFLIYGAHASIIMHWFFNSYTDVFFLFSDIYPTAATFSNTIGVITIILGILGWLTTISLLFFKLKRNNKQNNKLKLETKDLIY